MHSTIARFFIGYFLYDVRGKVFRIPYILAKHSKKRYIFFRGNKMAAKVKPVQPTEIKDKKIARQVIEEIRKPIPPSVYRRNKEIAELIDKMTRK